MAIFRYSIGIAAIALALTSCKARPQDPSPESRFLQNRLVPAITKWSQTNSPTMNLFQSELVRSFDHICIVQEYLPLNRINARLPYVDVYKGSVGERVPENRTAIIGVKKNVAHVAYYPLYPLTVYSPKRCVDTRSAILRMEGRGRTRFPSARLEEMK